MNAYKVTILIVDHDQVGEGIADAIENVRYPNRCISPRVIDVERADIGDWTDGHPLNHGRTWLAEVGRLFGGASEHSSVEPDEFDK